MRRRQGRAGLETSCVPDRETPGKNSSEGALERQEASVGATRRESVGETKERVFSWFDVIRAGAQLTLDVLRVVREASDLFRKLSGGKGAAGP